MKVGAIYENEIAAYRDARARNNVKLAWHHLERAHIVSQPHVGLHFSGHLAMFTFALSLRDWPEAWGQVARLALVPLGAIVGRIPRGNTGRASVSVFQSMPVPSDLKMLLEEDQPGGLEQ
ncbi:MAG: DUF3703 domain-containing protein [Pseudomonadota bacterium]